LLKNNPAAIAAIAGTQQILLPLPVVAELRFGFLGGSKTKENEMKLERFLAQPHVDILTINLQTTEYFARLQFYAKKKARALSHNDLWIAALAEQFQYDLVTFDRDFVVFIGLLKGRLHILGTQN
jgi:predicted nucleic acid-binding protein